ncbi:NAD(P)-dependent oxidoreductase [Danxiaibacter flavus]|uniref:NAD(P)-dependent oxidoreductase n=1 Tax=Danxiaibacter flavus TaxID=3049108 RepID=A0ABV3ZAT7_9BACT|nr:NAD(P)-dependent oxidoreductase [Chitinophagaceae bacterium DXS]
MKIVLIGATGFVGSHLLKEALHRNYDVTAIVRDPSKLAVNDKHLTIVKGDVYNEDELTGLLEGYDVVVSAFNSGWQNPNIYNDFLKGSDAINNAAKKAGIRRIIIVGGAGSLFVAPGVQAVDTDAFPAEWKQGALGARDALTNIQKDSSLDWTFLSPPFNLHPGERTASFRIGHDEPIFNEKGESSISVEDLAVALFNELEKGEFIQRRFTVGY